MIRCPFCSRIYGGPFVHNTTGVQTLTCPDCRRAFIVVTQKRWWHYQYSVHVR